MKTASVRMVQHHLAEVLGWVEQGEEISVTRRNKVVARLVPPEPRVVATPDFAERAKAIWGPRPAGKRLSKIVLESRGNR